MPTSRKRGIRRRRKRYGDAELHFLKHGMWFSRLKWEQMRSEHWSTETVRLSDGTTKEVPQVHREWTQDCLDEMREAWSEMREAAFDGFADEHPGCRPYGWWLFESPEPRDRRLEEVAQLDKLGLLPEGEANRLRHTAHGIRNEYYATPFRRKWAWWKFLSEKPWRWDGPTEVEQLLEQPCALTDREKSIWRSKYDDEHAEHTRLMELSEDELLQLGVELVEPVYKHGCRPIDPSLRK